MALPSTDNYQIVVTPDPEHIDIECYGIKNVEYGVVEYYDNLLPRTFQAMQQMEEKYVEMQAAIDGGTQLELIPSTVSDMPQH